MPVETPEYEYTCRREIGTHPISNMPFGLRWVVRRDDATFVDCDQYRNDLKERYPNLRIIDTRLDDLDGQKVRLMNGDVVTLEHVEGTKNRVEHYRSRCQTHMFTMDGKHTVRTKYDIVEVV